MKRTYYSQILPSHEIEGDKDAYLQSYCNNIDWESVETEEQHIAHVSYYDTFNGIDVYYCYGTDEFLFVKS